MNTVWVLLTLVYNGHFGHPVVPTLEFKTREACVRAIETFKADAEGKDGTVRMRCVRIEK